MFGWLSSNPKCPVEPETKAWIETRFAWLTEQFGMERLSSGTIVLPTAEFFPREYTGAEEDVADLMERVAHSMDVDSTKLRLNFYEDDSPQFEGMTNFRTAGLYSESDAHFDIWLEVNGLENPAGVVATLAHEIGHVILLGQKRIAPDTEDHENLTDLLTVFLGLGIFTANNVIHETNWFQGGFSGWSVGKRGYLSMDMYGYAMALYTLARNEPSPEWAACLRPDVRAALKRGVRYITETLDCEFLPAIDGVA